MSMAALLSAFRAEMVDTLEPYLWSDDDFFRYADDAQIKFCTLTDGLTDASSDLTKVEIVPDQEWYDLDERILKLRTASRLDTGRAVSVVNPETSDFKDVRFDGSTGPVKALVWGLEENKVRAWPMPSETVTIQMAVFRLPLTSIVDVDSTLEIAARHHTPLLLWIQSLAYLKQDSETFNKSQSQDFEMRFRNYCAEVKLQQSRARRITGAVAYGGL